MNAKANGRAGANGAAARIVMVDARELKPSPENEILYRERTANGSDFCRFAESVAKEGVQAALLVSLDDYVVPSPRRFFRTSTAAETIWRAVDEHPPATHSGRIHEAVR